MEAYLHIARRAVISVKPLPGWIDERAAERWETHRPRPPKRPAAVYQREQSAMQVEGIAPI